MMDYEIKPLLSKQDRRMIRQAVSGWMFDGQSGFVRLGDGDVSTPIAIRRSRFPFVTRIQVGTSDGNNVYKFGFPPKTWRRS